jgi:serine protease
VLILRVLPVLAAGLVIVSLPISAQQGSTDQVQFVGASAERFVALSRALELGLNHIPGELLIRFRPGAIPANVFADLPSLGITMDSQNSRWIGDVLYMWSLNLGDTEAAAVDITRHPLVEYAQPNYINALQSVPNDTLYSQQWNMNMVRAPEAWDINTSGGSGVTVAVIDSGLTNVDGSFVFRLWTVGLQFANFTVPFAKPPDFEFARIHSGADVVPPSSDYVRWVKSNGDPFMFDAVGHGTHVAGTIVQQTGNGFGYAGLAFGATLIPIKACFGPWDIMMAHGFRGVPGLPSSAGGCDTAGVVAGLMFAADNGIDVVNLSVGSTAPQPAQRDALRYAVQRGTFVAISGGNHAEEGSPTSYPAAYAAQIDGVMAVAAVNRASQRAWYSNVGSYIEIAAPGGEGENVPESVFQVGPNQSDLSLLLLSPAFNRYVQYGISGTSMASPHVAALAALLRSQGVTRPEAIEAAIKRFAVDLGPVGRDSSYGHGLIDARASLRGLGGAR